MRIKSGEGATIEIVLWKPCRGDGENCGQYPSSRQSVLFSSVNPENKEGT